MLVVRKGKLDSSGKAYLGFGNPRVRDTQRVYQKIGRFILKLFNMPKQQVLDSLHATVKERSATALLKTRLPLTQVLR